MFRMIPLSIILAVTALAAKETYSAHTCMKSMPTVTKVVNSLGSRLEQLIDNHENYFMSPLSISLALTMIYIGARGTTREQMTKGLELDVVGQNYLPGKLSESFHELLLSLENNGTDYSFLIANGAFIQTGYDISQYYMSNLKKFFKSYVQFLNFAEEEQATMHAINEWVSNHTKGKVAKLINQPLDTVTIMVLVNAVYFKGFWNLPFDEQDTRNFYFYEANGTSKVAPFMKMENTVVYYYFDEEKQYAFLELEYIRGNISMIFVLPDKMSEIPQYTLTSDSLCYLRSKFEERLAKIAIPKFKIEFKRELSKDMINLGMKELFSDKADLSGIGEQNDLHISLMVHKAVIEVNEKGSEASAISIAGVVGRKPEIPKAFFWANHPFLFYIVHRDTDTVLFSGRLMSP